MKSHGGQRGAALILLLGIIAALAVFAASLVMVLANQQGATAAERSRKTSLYYAEGTLDAAVSIAKAKTIPTTNSGSVWLPTSEVLAAIEAAGFPEGAELKSFKVYDNLATVDYSIWWDSNLDDVVWIEVTITYQGKTTRLRALVSQTTQSVVKVFPKAVVYSDTGINLTGTSDVYAIEGDGLGGTRPYVPASHGGVYATTIMAGGGKYSAANAQDFDATTSANLAAPTSTAQSVNINVNGSVSPNTFSGTVIGGVGLLSDYFDQAAQADLGDEAQAGETHAAAPAVPAPTPSTTLSASAVTAIQDSSTTTPYTTYANTSVQTASGTSITITRTTARTLSFKDLYVRGNLSVTGPVTLNVTGYLRVDGTLRINNTTATAVTDTIGGALYVAGTGSSSVANRVTLSSASLYVGGPLTMSNIITTTGLLYAADNLSLTGNVTARTTALVVVGGSSHTDTDFAISGASSPVTDQFGPIWVAGTAVWSGAASVQSTDYTNAAAKPAPMWIGILDRSGTFNDVYGPMWCVGNAGTSDVAVRFTGPSSGTACTVMCPLLATTEKTVTTGKVNFGTATAPMVYYMVCDNDQLYSNTCEWGSTGTFYGLMVIMEACIRITGGDGITPCIVGALFNGTPYKSGTSPSAYDIVLTGASSIAYDQAVIDAVSNTAITTTTTTTQIVPGSWQQLPLK